MPITLPSHQGQKWFRTHIDNFHYGPWRWHASTRLLTMKRPSLEQFLVDNDMWTPSWRPDEYEPQTHVSCGSLNPLCQQTFHLFVLCFHDSSRLFCGGVEGGCVSSALVSALRLRGSYQFVFISFYSLSWDAQTITQDPWCIFLPEYFTDLEGRGEPDPNLPWDFYSSSLFGKIVCDLCCKQSIHRQ